MRCASRAGRIPWRTIRTKWVGDERGEAIQRRQGRVPERLVGARRPRRGNAASELRSTFCHAARTRSPSSEGRSARRPAFGLHSPRITRCTPRSRTPAIPARARTASTYRTIDGTTCTRIFGRAMQRCRRARDARTDSRTAPTRPARRPRRRQRRAPERSRRGSPPQRSRRRDRPHRVAHRSRPATARPARRSVTAVENAHPARDTDGCSGATTIRLSSPAKPSRARNASSPSMANSAYGLHAVIIPSRYPKPLLDVRDCFAVRRARHDAVDERIAETHRRVEPRDELRIEPPAPRQLVHDAAQHAAVVADQLARQDD